MRSLRDLPIQRKLRFVVLITCTAALVVACAALFAFQFLQFRSNFERDLAAIAGIIGNNSTAAMRFPGDEGKADGLEILGSLRAKPQIVGAALVLKDGTVLARTGDLKLPESNMPSFAPGLQEVDGDYLYSYAVWNDGERLGTLILRPDYRSEAHKLLSVYAGILAAVLAISFLVAALISWRLEPMILGPIRYLAQITRKVASRNDYSVRAVKFVDDEIGSFTESFNSMLDHVESSDQALRHEIAERTRAEAELQRVHQQLMEASRQAGMAEIATGVLHNVGNVLNSVNVSATLIAERLGQSKTENLVKAAALLQEQNGSLAQFLEQDPKGKLLPGYLAEVSVHVAQERTDALSEVELLTKNIEHIKDIVARQQTYARVSGVIEAMPLESLVEDALRMNAGGFERHGVVVIRDFQPVPPVSLDKHKALQILVNVLRNAKYATDEAPQGSRRVTVQLRPGRENSAEVRVIDTGIGIAPENLTKIFSHGFTTRREGHGFGLHSAALAAQQMGGQLSAASAGIGKGATFTLELPLAANPLGKTSPS
jgi:two-component system, NtrC family, sensor kinase